MTDAAQVLASFRDPAGRVFQCDGRIIRVIDKAGRASLELAASSSALRAFAASGNFITTRELDTAEPSAVPRSSALRDFLQSATDPVLVEHDRIPFPNYPYEWSPEMLHAAASLTLDLCESLLPDGIGLKDATPYNVLFRGVQPVFVDLLSIEKRRPDDPVWLPYGQFVRTFLLPLLAARRWQTPLSEIFFSHRDGLYPADVYKRCGVLERFHPALLGIVSIPTWLMSLQSRRSESLYRPHQASSAEQAEFLLRHTFRRLRRKLDSLKPVSRHSSWSDYEANNSYTDSEASQKRQFVISLLENCRPQRVLDIGCNLGAFSVLAAQHGAGVVAIDNDQATIGALFRTAGRLRLPILPLVVDISRPTPGVGWNNAEYPSFLSRATGAFDAVLMLAVLHHLLVTERIPLRSVLDLAATLTTDLLLIEYVGLNDPMFQKLLRGRQALHQDFTREFFEQTCKGRFHIIESKQVQADRWLYLLRRLS